MSQPTNAAEGPGITLLRSDDPEVVDRLRQAGADVVHRFGDVIAVRGAPELASLGTDVQVVDPGVSRPAVDRAVVIADLDLEAFRLRQTAAWQRRRRAGGPSGMGIVASDPSVGELP